MLTSQTRRAVWNGEAESSSRSRIIRGPRYQRRFSLQKLSIYQRRRLEGDVMTSYSTKRVQHIKL
jgi:hypothetical protein